MITTDSIEFKWINSMTMHGSGHIMLRDENLKIQCEKITPRNVWGDYGNQKTFFFIDDDPREFLTIDDLVDAYNEKFPQDEETPEVEIQYVRIRINRKTKKIIKPEQQ